ncbi:MAG TPA: SCP2 sterol-binding domain-containing protein [Paraburkholderia sp.]|nr:SCP2 sterol-binding domain-containing protein [Paraburkholderia sp.]
MNLLAAFPVPLLRGFVSRLPARPPAMACCAMLNQIVLPTLDADTRARMTGRRYVIDVADIGLVLGLTLRDARFEAHAPQSEPDLRITAKSVDFVRLAARDIDADTLFFNRRLVIQGDTELGLIVRNAIDSVDIEASASGRLACAALRRTLRVWAAFETSSTNGHGG